MRSLWKPEPEPFYGKFFRWGQLESHPKPVQQPGVPIVVGGHTELAARRAARYGDGFFPGVTDEEKLDVAARRSCARSATRSAATRRPSRSRRDAPCPTPTACKRLQDLGVSRFMVPPPAFDPDGITEGLERLGNLIAKVR